MPRGSRLKIAASCFSIYAFEALKSELSKVESLQFIFTSPTFVPTEVTDRLRKERREFFIPKSSGESSLYGTEFEIQLRNKLTQRAVARECADWIRKKARFKSNATTAPMQQFVHVAADATVHSAKGLEFDHVWVLGLAETVLRSWQSLQSDAKSAELEEERRNCFVAVTRTRNRLILTSELTIIVDGQKCHLVSLTK